jgi:hypothetical protein
MSALNTIKYAESISPYSENTRKVSFYYAKMQNIELISVLR